jgi:hypothetical protein
MNGTLALAMAVSGGFFIAARVLIVRAFEQWTKGPHERGECPLCKGPMAHEEYP